MRQELKIKDIYPLAPLQQGFLFHWLSDNDSSMYYEQFEYTITGELDIAVMEKSLNILIERYDLLRTIFMVERVKEPLQVVLKERKLSIYFEDISHLSGKKEKYSYIEAFRKEDRKKGFDLSKDLLFKFCIFKTLEDEFKMIWSFHHIMMDAWSHEILYRELIQVYSTQMDGKPLDLEPVIPYKNYIQWLEKQDKEKGLKYWQEYLHGFDEAVVIPVSNHNRGDKRAELEKYRCYLPPGLSDELLKLAEENLTTIYTVFQTIWGILLQKYCNVDDVVYGAVVSGRPPELEEVETIVGLFINTIPVRIKTREESTFSQLLGQVKEKEIVSKLYEYLPLADVQSCSPLKRDLINHIIVYESRPVGLKKNKDNRSDHYSERNTENKDNSNSTSFNLNMINMESYQQVNYDFSLLIHPTDPLKIGFYFVPSTYEIHFIKNMSGHLIWLIEQVVANPLIKIKDLEIITAEEKKKLLFDFNKRDSYSPKKKMIHQLVEEQVEKIPDKIAVKCTKELVLSKKEVISEYFQLTYKKLNKKSNQLTHLLIRKGLNDNTTVGIIVERSLEMIIGILGILKGGGAYLPINADLPQKCIDYILKDSGATFLITTSLLNEQMKNQGGFQAGNNLKTFFIEDLQFSKSLSHSLTLSLSHPSNLAYIIYTSGTTGNPKGVAINHSAVMPLFQWGLEILGIGPHDRTLQNLSHYFDWSVWEIFITLGTGAVLVILPTNISKDPEILVEEIDKQFVTVLHVTPTQYRCLSSISQNQNTLNYLFIGAEVLPLNLVKRSIEQTNPDCRIFNMYGPTETSIVSTVLEIDRNSPGTYGHFPNIAIGQPVGNTVVLITDKYFHLCPIWVAGELYIAGDGLALGYLNQPQLTAEKFDHDLLNFCDYYDEEKIRGKHKACFYIKHENDCRKKQKIPDKLPMNKKFLRGVPWNGEPIRGGQFLHKEPPDGVYALRIHRRHPSTVKSYKRVYKTGDLARWLPDGNIDFLGRIDQQVKIRGFRIELGEIESQLASHEDIKEAVAVIKEEEDGDSKLMVFVVGSNGLNESDLREYLANRLPGYMLPANILQVDQIPMNHNGKVDRKALYEQSSKLRLYTQHIAPQNQMQQQMARVWQEVLKRSDEEIGIYDNFFDLGGDSIKIIHLRSRLNKSLNKSIQVTTFFEYPTIHSLSQYLNQEEAEQEINNFERINKGRERLHQRMNQRLKK